MTFVANWHGARHCAMHCAHVDQVQSDYQINNALSSLQITIRDQRRADVKSLNVNKQINFRSSALG